MGNLILGHALATDACRLDSSSDWIALQGPLMGSQTASVVKKVCADPEGAQKLPSALLELVGRCPASPAVNALSPPSANDTDNVQRFSNLVDTYRERVSAALCGVSPQGIPTMSSVMFNAASAISQHTSPNDGVVEWQSCGSHLDDRSWGRSYESRFYEAKLNHFDGQFRNGDGWFGKDRKPLRWFECLF